MHLACSKRSIRVSFYTVFAVALTAVNIFVQVAVSLNHGMSEPKRIFLIVQDNAPILHMGETEAQGWEWTCSRSLTK